MFNLWVEFRFERLGDGSFCASSDLFRGPSPACQIFAEIIRRDALERFDGARGSPVWNRAE